VVKRILSLASRLWRDETDRPWLPIAPLIQMQRHPHQREPYPLSVAEQTLLFSELATHLVSMALFKVNTGLREQEVVNLRWQWESRIPELGASIFGIPRDFVKNALDRYVVLNRIARSVVNECRGGHPEFVFSRKLRGPQAPPRSQSPARDDPLLGTRGRRTDRGRGESLPA
jgi:integrase